MRLLVFLAAAAATPVAARAQIVPPEPVERVAPDVGRLDTLTDDSRVVVWLRVAPDGSVDSSRVGVGLSPRLDSAAHAAARRWRFTPGTQDGQPVAMWTRAAFRFERTVPVAALVPSLGTPWRPPVAPPPAPVTADGGVDSAACVRFVAPVARRHAAPVYPSEHRVNGEEGRVVMRVRVGVDGRPTVVAVQEATDRLFEQAAVQAVGQWRFTPAVCDDVASKFVVTIPIRFRQNR